MDLRRQLFIGNRNVSCLALLGSALLLSHSSYPQSGPLPPPSALAAMSGVVIEDVKPDSAAQGAGLKVGDAILSWSRGTDTGKTESPFDWIDLEVEQIPRGPVTLRGIRGSREKSWTLSNTLEGVTTRPMLRPELMTLWQRCRELEKAEKWLEAAEGWRAIIGQVKITDPMWLPSWLQYRLAEASVHAGRFDDADLAFQLSIEKARSAVPTTTKHLLLTWGTTFADRSNWARAEETDQESLKEARRIASPSLSEAEGENALGELERNRGNGARAEKFYQQALAIREKLAPGSLEVAASLNDLGIVADDRSDLDQAESYDKRALEIRQKVAPGSLDVAKSLNSLGNVAIDRGDLLGAESYYQQALTIVQKQSPASLAVASILTNMGLVSHDRGDLDRAEEYHQQALAIRQKLAPGSLYVAASLNNLGIVADDRGDLGREEEYHEQALAIRQKLAPDSLMVATSLNNLGVLARNRGDLHRAEEYQREALATRQRLAPSSLDVAMSLNNLGVLALDRGELDRAEQYHQQALAIKQKLAPGSIDVGWSLTNLGEIAEHRGDLSRAEDYFRQALAIYQKLSPGGLDTAMSLDNLGYVAKDRGNLTDAKELFQQALQIYQRLAPGSLDEATTLYGLGAVLRAKGDLSGAADHFSQAFVSLEKQTTRLGGTEDVQSSFRAKYASWYLDFEDVLLTQKKLPESYGVSERYRARSLLQMLAERDLVFAADVPAVLQRARKRNAAEYDRVQAQIGELNPTKDEKKIDELLVRLRELSAKREQIAEEIKKTSPRFASLEYPQPLDLNATRQVLDPGTALLSYSVGQEHTVLFIVRPVGNEPGLSVFTLPVREKELQASVQEFRKLIEQRREGADPTLVAASRRLYDLLLRPAESVITMSDRLLIVPDGPLQVLPFAALLRSEKQYLVEWKALDTVVSATVYAELKKSRDPLEAKTVELAAFGDPRSPIGKKEEIERSGSAEMRFVSERGFTFGRLPFSRPEVEQIAALYPQRSKKYLGADATEEHAKALGKDVRYIHFATHGLLDERFPLDSAIVLTVPEKVEEGRENGLLQAWEIFEQVRLDADLVTLSACNTGLGQELSGEGLIGLTRAFQYAGARSVLASLWSVDDFQTMELMGRFYASLKAGASKDEALRQAQIDLIHSRSSSSPHYWAAFTLAGDWR
jgi:CHAT domain-containing protein/Tfp pilus assembly protein PilF